MCVSDKQPATTSDIVQWTFTRSRSLACTALHCSCDGGATRQLAANKHKHKHKHKLKPEIRQQSYTDKQHNTSTSMPKLLFRRDRARSTGDAELDSWLCDDRSRRSTCHQHHHYRSSTTSTASPSIDRLSVELPAPPSKSSPSHRSPQAITYLWDRRVSQALELGRRVPFVAPTTSVQSSPSSRQSRVAPGMVIHWRPGTETLGITLDVETTTRQIIVIRSTRRDVRAGAILLRIAGQSAHESTFYSLLASAKASRGITVALEFAAAPAPVVVLKPNFELAMLGVDKDAFELVAVNGVRVRYLALQDIYRLIRQTSTRVSCSSNIDNNIGNSNNENANRSSNIDTDHEAEHTDNDDAQICEMVFERVEHDAGAQHQQRENKRTQDHASANSTGVVTAMAAVAAISSALS